MTAGLVLGWCDYDAARYAVEHWHYSRRMPKSKLNTIGVWEDDTFRGAIVFGYGATAALVSPYGLTMHQGCELVRVALSRHVAPVSQMLAVALRLLAKKNPGLRLVVSFADTGEGHHGGIYQASGWVYAGMTPPATFYRDARGKVWHPRNVSNDLWRSGKMVRPVDCVPVVKPGKHRYLFPLDAEMKRQIAPLSQSYPKRVEKNQEPGNPPGLGGEIPTSTLHPT